MANKNSINRRDFLAGVALTGAAFGLSPLEAMTKGLINIDGEKVYPPALTGLRGSHEGSFEVAHAISWAGEKYSRPDKVTDKPYDLIIVGGGISGLATAHYARASLGEDAKILILDNHDDFGGHAKRNEFNVDGQTLIGHGGSQSIDTPSSFSAEATGLLKDIGIETDKFYDYYHRDFFKNRNLGNGLFLKNSDQFFSQKSDNVFSFGDEAGKQNVAKTINALPLSSADKKAMKNIFVDQADWLKGHSVDEKIALLRSNSYEALIQKYGGLSDAAVAMFTEDTKSLFATGWDCWSGLEALRLYHPGTTGLGIDPMSLEGDHADDPYIFHFPDGNAGIAWLLVKRLVPDSTEGADMDTIVKAQMHYDRLDRPENPTRIRLNATAVRAENRDGGVEVTYVRGDKVERVVGKKTVMACYNHILPFIMPEMQEDQTAALQSVEKAPLAYINVAVRNWHAWKKAGVRRVLAPGCEIGKAQLDYPVSMGGYKFTTSPDEPTIVRLVHVPSAHREHIQEQNRQGRHKMYAMSFEDYEREIRLVLEGTFERFGFDFDKEVAAITVNRWPHGYAYEYNELYDDPTFGPYHGSAGGPDKGPHVLGRKRIGNITIANSDSSAYAYVQGALDAAHRAVGELYND